MTHKLGIDFGTSNIKISISCPSGNIYVLPIGLDKETLYIPSVIAYSLDLKNKFIGDEVLRNVKSKSKSEKFAIIHDVKRYLNEDYDPGNTFNYAWRGWPEGIFTIGTMSIKLEDIVYEIFNNVIDRTKALLKKESVLYEINNDTFNINDCGIRMGSPTPTSLIIRKIYQRVMTEKLKFSNFAMSDIYEEPVLAALAESTESKFKATGLHKGDLFIIYDLGGGTFDTSVVNIVDVEKNGTPVISVVSTDGEPFCGGKDIDKAIKKDVVNKLSNQLSRDSKIVGSELDDYEYEIMAAIEDAKISLSDKPQAIIDLPGDLKTKGYPNAVELAQIDLWDIIRQLPINKKKILDNQKVEYYEYAKFFEATISSVMRAWKKARMYIRYQRDTQEQWYFSNSYKDLAEDLTFYIDWLKTKGDKKPNQSYTEWLAANAKKQKIETNLADMEPAFGYFLNYEKDPAGILSKPVTSLTIDDLKEKVKKVLLVGGACNTPYIRQRLEDYFGKDKIVLAASPDPVSAVSVGAASEMEPRWANVQYLPYSVYVGSELLYEPFTPINEYISEQHKINHYKKQFKPQGVGCSLIIKGDNWTKEYPIETLLNRECYLQINDYGEIFVKNKDHHVLFPVYDKYTRTFSPDILEYLRSDRSYDWIREIATLKHLMDIAYEEQFKTWHTDSDIRNVGG